MKPPTKSTAAPRLACPTKLPKARCEFEEYERDPKTQSVIGKIFVAHIPLRQRPTRARLDAVQKLMGMSDQEIWDAVWIARFPKNPFEYSDADSVGLILRALGLLAAQKGRAGK